MVLTFLEYGVLALLTTLTGLLSAYIVYRVIRPRLKNTIQGYIPVMVNAVSKKMGKMGEEAIEGLDLTGITAQLGGGEGDLGGLAAIQGLLGGSGGSLGGLGEIIKLLGAFGGQKGQKGGHNPGK